jgi:MFS family permease
MTLGNFITAIATLLSSLLIVNQHLYDYQTVWTILSVLSAIGILISAVLFKETISLEKRDSWDLKKLCTNPSKSVILKYSYLSRLVFALFLLILSIMSVTILPGYVVELYSWKQEYVVYLQLGASLISTFAAGITFSLIPKYGSRFVLQLSYACGFLAIFLLLLSYFSPVIMIIANIFLGLSFMGTPAYYDELSKHVPQNEQGRVQSCMFSVFYVIFLNFFVAFSAAFLVAAGIGAVIYGKIFQSLPLNAVYVPFLIAILIYVVSWAFVTYLFRSFAESTSELQARIQHVELEESMTSPEIAGYDLKNKNLI